MTGDQLNTQLGFRLEDTAESIFTKQQKVDAINNAMNQVVVLVDNTYLDELETSTSGSVSNGQALFSALFSTYGNPETGTGELFNKFDPDAMKLIKRYIKKTL